MRRLLTATLLLAAAPLFAAKAVLLVNGKEVSEAQVGFARNMVAAQLRGKQVAEDVLLRRSVDQLIAQMLLEEAAREAGVSATAAEVDASMQRQKQAAGGDAKFAAALQGAGLTEEEVRAFEAGRLTVQRLIQTKVAPTVTVSAEEVSGYYRDHPEEFRHEAQLRIRMVLAAVPSAASPDQEQAARARAERALKRLQAGEDFAVVAGELSDDASKAKGGEVGWVRKGMLIPELEAVVFALKDGELSGVLKSQYGYHVFRVDGRRDAGTYPFEEIRESLNGMLTQRKTIAVVNELVTGRRKRASILALDPKIEAALSPVGASPTPK